MITLHPHWADTRLLRFLNRARTATSIYHYPDLRDDPNSGISNGYIIGEKVAQNILEFRQKLPRRRFINVEQLLEVKGLGQDKLNDLQYSFSTSADNFFKEVLFAEVLQDNWVVAPQSIEYETETDFLSVVQSGESFRRTAAMLYVQTLAHLDEAAKRQLEMRIHQAHQENYLDGHLGSFQFAFWWYLFDYDNWFSHEMIQSVCERYLDYHGFGDRTMELRILRLNGYTPVTEFQQDLIIPVVVNYVERRITIWEVQLND